ncbi:MAG: hypothetical protein SGI74_10590 [Oligoflexia bacterium]|nr:hypothetical protein [Oligoflexia bacterium]
MLDDPVPVAVLAAILTSACDNQTLQKLVANRDPANQNPVNTPTPNPTPTPLAGVPGYAISSGGDGGILQGSTVKIRARIGKWESSVVGTSTTSKQIRTGFSRVRNDEN